MRKWIFLIQSVTLIFFLLISSCSLFQSEEKENSDNSEDIFVDSAELKDSNVENSAEAEGEKKSEGEEADDFFSYKGDDWKEEEKEKPVEDDLFASAKKEEEIPPVVEKEAPAPVVIQQPAKQLDSLEGLRSYKVQNGDTLMWIAFKVYGDYRQWRKISSANGGIVSISEGQKINYPAPKVNFSWNPNGLPYLIKSGDTLGLISHKVYGKKNKWKSIYENNREMIRNPNLIFSGFTLYYLKKENQLAYQHQF